MNAQQSDFSYIRCHICFAVRRKSTTIMPSADSATLAVARPARVPRVPRKVPLPRAQKAPQRATRPRLLIHPTTNRDPPADLARAVAPLRPADRAKEREVVNLQVPRARRAQARPVNHQRDLAPGREEANLRPVKAEVNRRLEKEEANLARHQEREVASLPVALER